MTAARVIFWDDLCRSPSFDGLATRHSPVKRLRVPVYQVFESASGARGVQVRSAEHMGGVVTSEANTVAADVGAVTDGSTMVAWGDC